MNRQDIKEWYRKEIQKINYKRVEYHSLIDLSFLDYIYYVLPEGSNPFRKKSKNDLLIGFDTETSKSSKNAYDDVSDKYIPVKNYVVRWAISIRAFEHNIITIMGRKPSDFAECIYNIQNKLKGDTTYFYCHNLSYDWVFLRKFLFEKLGKPIRQLNTKSHYPINIEFENGIILRDSLILAQRSLNRWTEDMNVQHKKAVDNWDYDLIRNQDSDYTEEENIYQEYDTLGLVECLDAFAKSINKSYTTLPYTQTGVVRELLKREAYMHDGKNWFNKNVLDFKQYLKMLCVFHGGFTHANRFLVGWVLNENITKCYDFASSYPYIMLAYKFPSGKFKRCTGNITPEFIISKSEDYAFMFQFKAYGVRLKDKTNPMPMMQFSKAIESVNPVLDNGRIIEADYAAFYTNEIDFKLLYETYDFDELVLYDIEYTTKDYLPRWVTDFVYDKFKDKTLLKKGDKVLYNIAKSILNSCYGMFVQRPLRDNIIEKYDDNVYETELKITEEEYEKWMNKSTSLLPYQVGVWVTSIAMSNLFELGKCNTNWIYSDTDSIYSDEWNEEKIKVYNENCKQKLLKNGYEAVKVNGKEYWLGIAEHDIEKDTFSEFITLGSKRYAKRELNSNNLAVTVAGVPKNKGTIEQLDDSLYNFKEGFIFKGLLNGKKTHWYLYNDKIEIDSRGNEIGDSIDLTPCDYLLSATEHFDIDDFLTEEVNIQIYEED